MCIIVDPVKKFSLLGPLVSKHPVYHPQQPLTHQPLPPFFGTDLCFLQQQRHLTPSPIICPSSSSSSSSQLQHSLSRFEDYWRMALFVSDCHYLINFFAMCNILFRLTSSFRQSKKNSFFRKAAYIDESYQGTALFATYGIKQSIQRNLRLWLKNVTLCIKFNKKLCGLMDILPQLASQTSQIVGDFF